MHPDVIVMVLVTGKVWRWLVSLRSTSSRWPLTPLKILYTSYTPTGDKPTGQAGPGVGATAVSVALHQRLERECAEACHLLF